MGKRADQTRYTLLTSGRRVADQGKAPTRQKAIVGLINNQITCEIRNMPKFEAAIYNSRARDAKAGAQQPSGISVEWANVRFIEIEAMNESMARIKLDQDYPEKDGFVVEDVTAL